MDKIRLGNDIEMRWSIFTRDGDNKVPYNLEGRALTLSVVNRTGESEIEFFAEGNIVTGVFRGRDQRILGKHGVILRENNGKDGMRTIDACDAFELVACSCEEALGSPGTIQLFHLTFDSTIGAITGTIDPILNYEAEQAEAERKANEIIRKANEEQRIDNEKQRNVNEILRNIAEEERKSAEQERIVNEDLRKADEAERKTNEESRLQSESERVSSEEERLYAESIRVANENARIASETKRAEAETARIEAEDKRIVSEKNRLSAESSRIANEDSRRANEDSRLSAEAKRVSAEEERQIAEEERQAKFASMVVQTTGEATDKVMSQKTVTEALNGKQEKLVAGKGISIDGDVISAKLDMDIVRVVDALPSVGEANIIYLVPAEQPSENDLFEEWVWTDKWERIGSTKIDLSDYATKGYVDTKISSTEENLVHKDGFERITERKQFQKGIDIGLSNSLVANEDRVQSGAWLDQEENPAPFIVADPSADDHAATKYYVDKSLATKQDTLTDTDGSYGQRVAELEVEGIASQEKLSELGATVDSLTKGVPEKTIDYSSRPMTASSYWLKGADGKISFAASGMGLRRVDVIDIAEGDTIIVDTDKGSANAKPILICDENDNVVYEQVSYSTKHYEITAESGYAKLYINSIKDTAFACLVHTPQKASEIDTIKDALVSHDSRITALEGSEQSQVAMPLIAPSPQLPANDKAESDFNAETVLSTDIQAYLDDIVSNKQPTPTFNVSGVSKKGCKYATMYDVVGKDASGQYDMKAYVLSRRNRFAYKAAGKYYAWKNGTSFVYTQNRTPIVGDHIYNSDRQEISGNIASYNSGSQSISVNGMNYTRDDSATLGELVLYADYIFEANSRRNLFDKKDKYVTAADSMDGRTFVYGGNTYTRYHALDYHTDNKATIVIWANEHAAQSDPHEASIVLARMMNDLCSGGCRGNKMLQYMRSHCKIVLIPCANPFGMNKWAENHREGRNNSNNVNINRNYDTKGWSVITDTDKGSSAGDQSETQFIMNLCNEIEPDIAIDIHCLSYTTALNDSRCHYEGRVFETENDKVKETMESYFGLVYTSYGDANPDGGATGADWIYSRGWFGGLIEMNAGRYANSYNGNQHSDYTLEADYTLLLNTLAMWYHGYDPTVDFRKL